MHIYIYIYIETETDTETETDGYKAKICNKNIHLNDPPLFSQEEAAAYVYVLFCDSQRIPCTLLLPGERVKHERVLLHHQRLHHQYVCAIVVFLYHYQNWQCVYQRVSA